MTTINGVNVAYTQNGNVYKKSTTGKKMGTVAGLVGVAALAHAPLQKVALRGSIASILDIKNLKDLAKKFINGDIGNTAQNLSAGVKNGSMGVFNGITGKGANEQFIKLSEKIAKMSKKRRVATVLLATGLVTTAFVGIGRGIGKIYDYFTNSTRAKNADNNAVV